MSKQRKKSRRTRGDARVRGPLDLRSSGSSQRRRDEKRAAQLCAQVERALSLALANMEDERLLYLYVMEVVPAPDASRLAVRVMSRGEPDDALAALDAALPLLRSEVAAAIHRKRVPHLTFDVIPHDPSGAPFDG